MRKCAQWVDRVVKGNFCIHAYFSGHENSNSIYNHTRKYQCYKPIPYFYICGLENWPCIFFFEWLKAKYAYILLGIIKYSDEFNQLLNIVYFFSYLISFILLFYSTIITVIVLLVIFIVYLNKKKISWHLCFTFILHACLVKFWVTMEATGGQ